MVARRGHPLQPEEKQQIVKLHEAGYTQVAIAQKLNRSKPTISSYLKGMPPGMGGKMYRQAKDALEAGAPKEPSQWRTQAKMAIEDIAYFARRYYGCIIMPFQEEGLAKIMELLDTPQREYVVINQAPGTGKSMFFTRIVPAWLTVQRRDIRGMIGSISQGMATRYLEALRNDFTRRQPIQPSSSDIAAGISVDAEACLVDDFGRFRPEAGGEDSWTQRGFTVAQLGRRPTPHKEQTWIAVGAETEYIGTRVDIAIWDDAWSDSFTTVESKQRFYRSFDMVAERRLEPHGLLVLQGQRMASDDIYRYCLDKRAPADDDDDDDLVLTGQMYHHIKFPAHFDDRCEGKHDKRIAKPYPDGCLLYPKRVPWSDLRMIRDKSMAEYQLLYQQEDADLEDCLVKEIWVKGGDDADGTYPGCWDWRRDLCQLPEGLNRGLSVCSVDVSPTQMWAVQWWYVVASLVGGVQYRYLMDLEGVKMQSGQFLDFDTRTGKHMGLAEEWMIRSHALKAPITHWVVEINAAQRFLFQYQHVREWQAKWRTQIVPHTTGRNKSDPELGVGQLGRLYRNGLVRLPGLPQNVGGNAARWKSLRLIDEAKRWRPGIKTRDDQVMAQWFLEFNLPKLSNAQAVVPIRDDIPSWVAASA